MFSHRLELSVIREMEKRYPGKVAIGMEMFRTTQQQALEQKRQTSASVMTPQAIQQMDKEIDKLKLDIQYMQQTAQKEVEDLNNDLMNEFYQKIVPVLETIAKEKGLHAIFSAQDAGAIYIHPGLDMTSEIVKKLDATYKK